MQPEDINEVNLLMHDTHLPSAKIKCEPIKLFLRYYTELRTNTSYKEVYRQTTNNISQLQFKIKKPHV
jgi:hypothetical protein